MTNNILIRSALKTDRAFILELSPSLAQVANLPWHSECVMRKMQDEYIEEMLDNTSTPQITLIAEKSAQALGFIHAFEHKDSISGEVCGTVTLLAVSSKAQGLGAGKMLVQSAEAWAKEQGYRLLHLEVFANNDKALGFYQNIGFEAETLHMIKTIG